MGKSWHLYIKSSVTSDETADVINDRTTHPDFKHASTADQFFTESQCESYRQLSEHIGSQILVQGATRDLWLNEL